VTCPRAAVRAVATYWRSSETTEVNFNLAGRIKQETSEAGTKTYEYDELGNVIQQSWSLFKIDDEDDTYTATMAYAYDPFGRLLTMSFPGRTFQETVAYGYDSGGNVTSAVGTDNKGNVVNYLLGMGYDEFEQRTRMISGNGITTTYAYDPLTRRLANVNASELDPQLVQQKKPARPFQQMAYAYDPVGNITTIQNNAPFDPHESGQVQVGPETERFVYDDLYQLRTAPASTSRRATTRLPTA
jgi:YD repeat-containing protein